MCAIHWGSVDGSLEGTLMFASEQLVVGQVYSRAALRELFDIKDANFLNGVFRLKDYDSIFLFVTEVKSSDRTPYADKLDGDVLFMEGQRLGRTDKYIIDHRANGCELLLFYRKS